MTGAEDLIARIAPHHRLLLAAALCETDPARRAWRSWCDSVHFDDVDGPAVRLLPILSQRTDIVDANDPLRGRIQGIARKSWVTNERLLADSIPARAALVAARLPVLHVEALPLAEVFGDRGRRPLHDIDFCVPRRSMRTAIRILDDLGWRPVTSGLRARWQHWPRHLVRGDGHLRLIDDVPWPGADRSAWETSTPTESGETLLGLHDALVHAAVRSTQPWQHPPAYWVADIVRMSAALGYTRAGDALDDDVITRRAAAHHSSETVRAALKAADQLIGPTAI